MVARATAADPRRRFPTAAGLAQALATRSLARLPEPTAPGLLDFCLACGAPNPFGRTVCLACADSAPGGGDSWLIVHPPRLATDRAALAARLATLLHLPAGDSGPLEAAAGERALGRLPRPLAQRAARQLQARGVPVRLVSARADLRLLPSPLLLLSGAIAAIGTWAGLRAYPALLVATPALTALLVGLASRAIRRPLFAAPAADREPAARTRRRGQQGVGQLARRGGPRARRPTSSVWRALCSGAATGQCGCRTPIEALLRNACLAASELGRIEQALIHLAEQRARLDRIPEAWMADQARLDAARTTLLQHLLDAVATLGSALSEAAQPDSDVCEALARQSRELHEELTLRAEARAEVDALLGGLRS